MLRFAYVAASALVAVTLAGCGLGPLGTDERDVEIEGNWTFESGRTAEGELSPPPSGDVTLTFDGVVARGAAGCNDFGGEYDLDGGDLQFDGFEQTLMGCEDERGVFEPVYLAALSGVRHVDRDGDRLTLSGEDVSTRPAGDIAGSPIQLVYRR